MISCQVFATKIDMLGQILRNQVATECTEGRLMKLVRLILGLIRSGTHCKTTFDFLGVTDNIKQPQKASRRTQSILRDSEGAPLPTGTSKKTARNSLRK